MKKRTVLLISLVAVVALLIATSYQHQNVVKVTDVTVIATSTAQIKPEVASTTAQKVLETPTGIYEVVSKVSSEEEKVKTSFETYQSAAVKRDGKIALTYLSSATVAYYTEILDLIKKGDKPDIQNRSLTDRFMVLLVRHMFDRETILGLKNGSDFLLLALNNGLVGEQGMAELSTHSVTVFGDSAYLEISVGDEILPFKYTFVKENGIWRNNLVTILPIADFAFTQSIKSMSLTEDEYIMSTLEIINGIKPTEVIWLPIE